MTRSFACDSQALLQMCGETLVALRFCFHLAAARRANEEALAKEGRMSCHISMKKLTPFHVGALMYFFFLAIAYEGALAHVNAFDQPRVEDYKKILHEELREYISEN